MLPRSQAGLGSTLQFDRIVLIPKRGGAGTSIPGASAPDNILTRGHRENLKLFLGHATLRTFQPECDVLAYQGLGAGLMDQDLAISRREIVAQAGGFC
jgi:hypothetical protein